MALDSVVAIDRAYPADGEFKAPISIAMHALKAWEGADVKLVASRF